MVIRPGFSAEHGELIAAQHRDLMAKNQGLRVLGSVAARQEGQSNTR
jgi:hypothetical protein